VFDGCSGFHAINVSNWTDIPTIAPNCFLNWANSGTIYVPSDYGTIGISQNTFTGLSGTWALQQPTYN
jgi:hypothetical protein